MRSPPTAPELEKVEALRSVFPEIFLDFGHIEAV
jgi:hypothetical protein